MFLQLLWFIWAKIQHSLFQLYINDKHYTEENDQIRGLRKRIDKATKGFHLILIFTKLNGSIKATIIKVPKLFWFITWFKVFKLFELNSCEIPKKQREAEDEIKKEKAESGKLQREVNSIEKKCEEKQNKLSGRYWFH